MRKGKRETPPEILKRVNRRVVSEKAGSLRASTSKGHHRGGYLYMQTNEIRNGIVHYHRSANGALSELQRLSAGGAGSGTFKPISGQESAPNAFEGAGSVILSPDRPFLFATNGGDNSVSGFSVGEDGWLTLLDLKPTRNPAETTRPNGCASQDE